MTENEHVSQESHESDDQPAIRDRPVNPFVAGAPVSGPEMFYGRDDVFAFIQRNLIGRHHDTPIVLKGERRTGKTSVLYQVHRHLDPAYRCVSIDLHGLSLNGIGDLLNGIATSVSNSLRSDYAIAIAPPDRSAFDADPRSAFESIFLDAVLAALGKDHLVLMLDEVVRLDEKVRSGQLEPEVFGYLRHLMQHHPRLNFIFSLGSGLEEMQKDYAFLFSPALYHRISFLEEAAARKLITEPVREHYEMSPDAVDTIIRIASGHPYYTQLVCQSLFDRWSSRPPKPVMTAEDVYPALGDAIERGSPNLTYVWEDSSPEEKAVMAAMAAAMRTGRHAVTGKAIRETWRKTCGSLPDRKLSAALRSLASREVITGVEAYSFSVDLQRLWLDKHRRLDWVKDELAEPIQQWTHDTRIHRTRYIAAGVALLVLVGGLVAAKVAQVFPFSPDPELGLIQLMQGDLYLGNHHCGPATPPNWRAPGLVVAAQCTDQFLPGGHVYGYKMDNTADFLAAREDFNQWWGFHPASATTKCPPTGDLEGVVSDGNIGLAQSDTITKECWYMTLGKEATVPAYAWAFPQSDALIIAQGAPGSSYSALSSMPNQPITIAAPAADSVSPSPPATLPPQAELLFNFSGAAQYPCSVEGSMHSLPSAHSVTFTFYNTSIVPLEIIWLNFSGNRVTYSALQPGQGFSVNTYLNSVWMLADSSATCQGIFAINAAGQINVTG